MDGMTFKQFERSYPGSYKLNFPLCFQNLNDAKTLNYTNFYLTNEYLYSDIFSFDSGKLKSNIISTHIMYYGEYLNFSDVDPAPFIAANNFKDRLNYGIGIFKSTPTIFYISFMDNNFCRIYYKKNRKKYYLVSDINNNLLFINEDKLPILEDTIGVQDFIYMFSTSTNDILFFKKTETDNFILVKDGVLLKLEKNINDYVDSPFQISRNIYVDPNISHNSTYITYNNQDNNIDLDKSFFDIRNNFLLHKKYSKSDQNTDLIYLKNQLLQDDVFSSVNLLLSSDGIIPIREYTSIFQDIQSETSNEIELNYTMHQKSYKIVPGVNFITTPDNMYPFSKINVNDCKFVDCGAFSYTSPKYSDRIYKLSTDINNKTSGQYLLCTWLSGHPLSDNKVWIDRYYYPDLITKSEALENKPSQSITYNDYIENLILSNSDYLEFISNNKIFDKLSDLAFSSSEEYVYERVNILPSTGTDSINYCNGLMNNYPTNYFKKINESNKFTISFDLAGDDSSWSIESDRNDIPCDLIISKADHTISVSYTLYDPSTESYEKYSTTSTLKDLSYNTFVFSVDGISGDGYVYLNNEIIYNFNIIPYKYVRKQILYGDLYLHMDGIKTNILAIDSQLLTNLNITTTFTDPEYAYLLGIQSEIGNINDITISLPSGMRNSSDNIDLLQTVCGSSTFKSNNINIVIKNINIDNPILLEDIKSHISTMISPSIPSNTKINNVSFYNFK